MFSRRFVSTVAVAAIASLLVVSCNTQQAGNLAAQLGGALTGQSTYVLIPGFYEDLAPWIADQTAFDSFVRKYKDGHQITDREKAEILIQLGFVEYAREQISPYGISLLKKYYPESLEKRADLSGLKFAVAGFGEQQGVAYDLYPLAMYAGADSIAVDGMRSILAAPAGLGATAIRVAFPRAIGFITGITVVGPALTTLLVYEAVAAIAEYHEKKCQELGECSVADVNNDEISSFPKDDFKGADPGDCGDGYHRSLQNNVDYSCKPTPPDCRAGDSCSSIRERISRFNSCAESRQNINNMCYRGGDTAHQIAYTSARQKAAVCAGMLATCKGP